MSWVATVAFLQGFSLKGSHYWIKTRCRGLFLLLPPVTSVFGKGILHLLKLHRFRFGHWPSCGTLFQMCCCNWLWLVGCRGGGVFFWCNYKKKSEWILFFENRVMRAVSKASQSCSVSFNTCSYPEGTGYTVLYKRCWRVNIVWCLNTPLLNQTYPVAN